MKYLYIFIAISLFFLFQTCSPAFRQWYCTIEDVERVAEERGVSVNNVRTDNPCLDPSNYIPDPDHLDQTPVKYLRVNFHWMNTSDSSYNYVGKEAVDFIYGLLHSANTDLEKNHKMWLPYNNQTRVIPTRYQYVLTPDPDDPSDDGIYFHFDDELCFYVHKGRHRNLHRREVIEKYAVQPDSVLNIFIMPHHPDSVDSPTYLAGGVGVTLGTTIKMAGMFENKGPAWGYRGILNHEVGHVFGLQHTWAYNDGCDDTPRHPGNCWNKTDTPPCDTLASNNVMDYNALQNAWSPCQIGKIHYLMNQEKAPQRNLLLPAWRRLHKDRTIIVRDSVNWDGSKDLEGNLVIAEGGALTIRCRVSLPGGARITVEPGGVLVLDDCRLHNAFGDEWGGIEIQQLGNKKGKVVFMGDPVLENAAHPITPEKS